MQVELAYGRTGLTIEVPDDAVVIRPRYVPGVEDEEQVLAEALTDPTAGPPLLDLVGQGDQVAIVFCDITRPIPNDRILPVILRQLERKIPGENIRLINALGMHRKNTAAELEGMLGKEVAGNYEIIQVEADEPDGFALAGVMSNGREVHLNRHYLEADIRILVGFIEPHFFAGFSGGPKLITPGIASAADIMYIHSARMIGDPMATWGIIDGNPIQEAIREIAELAPPDFVLNVSLNYEHRITGVFSGELLESHAAGVEFVRRNAMQAVPDMFDIVITTNSGYPLDQNLYQAVKGMSAAAQVVKDDGVIIAAAACEDGIPDHGNFRQILAMGDSPQQILDIINRPDFSMRDQWEAQALAQILLKARLYIKTDHLTREQVQAAHLHYCDNIEETLASLGAGTGRDLSICVLPEGPQTIPYVSNPPA